MNDDGIKRPVEWARRINNRWIVHHGLGQRADDWMTHLADTDPGRLRISSRIARAMIGSWGGAGDPKPWFYSGLFHTATEDEARRFLAGHRLTTATVPAMRDDAEVGHWEEHLCTETRGLLRKLRDALDGVGRNSHRPGK